MEDGRTKIRHIRVFPEDLNLLDKQGTKINADFIHSCITEKDTHILNVEMEDDVPIFMYGYEANNRDIFRYLKIHPEAGEFIFQKYTSNQPFIRDLCNSKNPMFLPELSENLKNVFERKEVQQSIDSMRSEEAHLKSNLNTVRKEYREFQGSFEELQHNVEMEKSSLEELQRMNANIRDDSGLKVIRDHYTNVIEFAKTVFDIGDLSNVENWAQVATGRRSLDKAMIDNLKMILQESMKDMEYLKSNDFLSEARLDEVREELQKKKENLKMQNEILNENVANENLLKLVEKQRKVFNSYKNRVQLDLIDDVNDHDALLQQTEMVLERTLSKLKKH